MERNQTGEIRTGTFQDFDHEKGAVRGMGLVEQYEENGTDRFIAENYKTGIIDVFPTPMLMLPPSKLLSLVVALTFIPVMLVIKAGDYLVELRKCSMGIKE